MRRKKDTLILGIETSCDETAAAVVKDGREVLSNVIVTQIDFHKKYGGVVPEIASRKHLSYVLPVIHQAIQEAGITKDEIDGIAVTYGPGLVGALLVGLSAAKGLAFSWEKPLLGVNHIAGHIAANYISYDTLEPPFICLVVSGGHSHLVYVETYRTFQILGRTRDDAVGEAYDKIARVLGLGYPGGPVIDKAAESGKAEIVFPRVYFKDGTLDFSFSGVKTAVMNYINREKMKEKNDINVNDVAASFQDAVIEVLVENTIKAARQYQMQKIAIAGGVSANRALRQKLMEKGTQYGMEVYLPQKELCTDNAAMIAAAGYFQFIDGVIDEALVLNAVSNLRLNAD